MAGIEQGVGFPITAVDQFSGAFEKLKGQISSAEVGFARLSGVLGAVLGGGALGTFMRGTIDALDRLNDLSKSTGLSVEMLSGLRVAAKQSGSDLDGMAASINKLSVNIGKMPDKFRELGITAKDPLEAFKQFADVFAAIQDPQLKAALGAEALGKNWAAAAPLLAEGGAKIGEMVEKGAALSGVTAEAARQADEFNDKLVLLTGTQSLGTAAVSAMLPLLNSLADSLIKSQTGATGLAGAFSPLLEAGKAVTVLFGNVAFVLRGILLEGDILAAQATALASGDLGRAVEIGRMAREDAAQARAEFDAWEKSIMDLKPITAATTGEVKGLSAAQQAVADSAKKAARAFLEKGNAAEFAGKKVKEAGLHDAHVTAQKEHEIALAKIANREAGEAIDLEQRQQDAKNAAIRSMRESVEQMELEVSLLGKSRVEREVAIRLRALERAGVDLSTVSMTEYVARIREAVLAEEEFALRTQASQEALMSTSSMWNELGDRGARFFVDLAQHGTSAFKRLREELKDFAAEMLAIFAKRWIMQIGASLTGSSALAAQAGQVGQGTLAGSVLNWAGTGTGMMSSALAGGSEFLSGMTGSFMGPMAPGSAAAWGSQVGAFLTNPATIAILAVVAIAVALRARQGGPKEGGSFYGGFSSSGAFTGDLAVPGSDNGRLFTPNGGDAFARELGTGVASGFYATLARLGGSTAGMNFGFGYDRDPRGSADSRVSAMVTDSTGRVLYQHTQTAGRDDKDFETAVGLETRRAILAGLQGAELPEAVAAILRPLDAATASAEEIDKALAAAEAMSRVIAGLANLRIPGLDLEALRGFQVAGEELETTLGRVAGLWTNYQNIFLTDVEKITLAQGSVNEVFAGLGVAVPSSMEEFKKLVDGLDLTTEAGRTTFTALMQVAPAFAAVSNAARGMLSDFDSIMGRLRGPGYTSAQNQAGLESATRRFMSANAWTQGMDWRYVAQQITTITREDFQAYSTANQSLINEILGYTADLSNASTPVQDFAGYVSNASGAVDDYSRSLEQARLSLRDWAVDKLLGKSSALSSEEKYAFALQEYQRALGSGDIGYFRDSADALLGVGRDRFASGTEYTDLFNRVLMDAERLGGFSLGRDNGMPASIDQMRAELAAELRAANRKSDELRQQVNDLILAIREGTREQKTATLEAADSTARAVRGAVESVAR